MSFGIEKQMDNLDALKQMENPKVAKAVEDQLVELTRAEGLHKWPELLAEQVCIFAEEAGEVVKAANDLIHNYPADPETRMLKLKEEMSHAGAMLLRMSKHLW